VKSCLFEVLRSLASTKRLTWGICIAIAVFFCDFSFASGADADADYRITHLRCEYRDNPLGIDSAAPRLSWQIESNRRNVTQVAYRIRVATSPELLEEDRADLWDSGRVESNQSTFVNYNGKLLPSRLKCYWDITAWSEHGSEARSEQAFWTMGLLEENDWKAEFICEYDDSSVPRDKESLHLPPARQYRKSFRSHGKPIARATIYASSLGIYELYLNGQRIGDAYFAPGSTDYRRRLYYQSYDVTSLMHSEDNAIGAWVADGWYSGYVGFGLLTGIGTEQIGRNTYGKTPSVLVQLELDYEDGTRQTIATEDSWRVTSNGPIRQADLLMGEFYDARLAVDDWSKSNYDQSSWEPVILAKNSPRNIAEFYQFANPDSAHQDVPIVAEKRDLGFSQPKLEAFPGLPVKVTERISAKSVTRLESGEWIYDLGQNFAGIIELKIRGDEGEQIQIRYGEMLYPDGHLMTENLRKARATDYYICNGDPKGEIYQPRFTFHGFRYVEISG
jgi:alpha-L-rhamnosidase